MYLPSYILHIYLYVKYLYNCRYKFPGIQISLSLYFVALLMCCFPSFPTAAPDLFYNTTLFSSSTDDVDRIYVFLVIPRKHFGNRMRCCGINFCMCHMTDIDYLAKHSNEHHKAIEARMSSCCSPLASPMMLENDRMEIRWLFAKEKHRHEVEKWFFFKKEIRQKWLRRERGILFRGKVQGMWENVWIFLSLFFSVVLGCCFVTRHIVAPQLLTWKHCKSSNTGIFLLHSFSRGKILEFKWCRNIPSSEQFSAWTNSVFF